MGFFSTIKNRLAKSLLGDLVTDLGSLPIDEHGRQIAMSIRRYEGKPAHLHLKLTSGGESHHFAVTRMSEWADQFERVAQEMRKQV